MKKLSLSDSRNKKSKYLKDNDTIESESVTRKDKILPDNESIENECVADISDEEYKNPNKKQK